jgi:hypothetical protein
MRLRTTAPPKAFLMLKPKRLCACWFARKKTVKWELERRFPVRYTASNSPRRTNRAARGNSRPVLLGREPMASLLAACRKHLAATLRLHARTEPVRLGAPASPRLIRSLWQSHPPLFDQSGQTNWVRPTCKRRPLSPALGFGYFPELSTFSAMAEFHSGARDRSSVDSGTQPSTDRLSSRFRISKCSRPRRPGQETAGRGKNDTPLPHWSAENSSYAAIIGNPPWHHL